MSVPFPKGTAYAGTQDWDVSFTEKPPSSPALLFPAKPTLGSKVGLISC